MPRLTIFPGNFLPTLIPALASPPRRVGMIRDPIEAFTDPVFPIGAAARSASARGLSPSRNIDFRTRSCAGPARARKLLAVRSDPKICKTGRIRLSLDFPLNSIAGVLSRGDHFHSPATFYFGLRRRFRGGSPKDHFPGLDLRPAEASRGDRRSYEGHRPDQLFET